MSSMRSGQIISNRSGRKEPSKKGQKNMRLDQRNQGMKREGKENPEYFIALNARIRFEFLHLPRQWDGGMFSSRRLQLFHQEK